MNSDNKVWRSDSIVQTEETTASSIEEAGCRIKSTINNLCGEKLVSKQRDLVLELAEFFEMQKKFDRKLGWDLYERCRTPEDALMFMEHFVLVMVEELGEISRARKSYFRDKKSMVVNELRQELMDVFVYFMQACMALDVDVEKEYLKKLRSNEERFLP